MPSEKTDAIITARGGSKGLARKNLRLLEGKPLIAHAILAAKGCPRINRCWVSTEDAEIKAESLRWGAEVIDRPAELATDWALSRDVVAHALGVLRQGGAMPEFFALLQPTSPLRTAAHLTACLDAFHKSRAACAISVTDAAHSPYRDFKIEKGFLAPLMGRQWLEKPRQELPAVYQPNGALYVMSSRVFLDALSFFVEPALPFPMRPEDSVDIDTELDLLLAERILENRRKQNREATT